MTRYVIIGAGAIGATVAAQLLLADVPVVVAARGAQLAALRAGGLTYISPGGTQHLDLDVVGDPGELGLRPGDVLVFATKSQDTEAALQQWAWAPVAMGPAGRTGAGGFAATELPVLMLQNGIENERAALRRFERVYGAMVTVPATFLRPGEVIARAAMPGAFWIGRYPAGLDRTAHDLADALRLGGFAVQLVPDIGRWKAEKLLINLSNALDALFPAGPLRDRAAKALRGEAEQVLAVAGIDVAERVTESTLDLSGMNDQLGATGEGPDRDWKHSSTWQSLNRAGTVESDFLNGEIVLLAGLHGVAAPLNRAMQTLVAGAAVHALGPGSLGEDELRELLDGSAAATDSVG